MEENCKNILIFFEKTVFLLLRLCGHPVEDDLFPYGAISHKKLEFVRNILARILDCHAPLKKDKKYKLRFKVNLGFLLFFKNQFMFKINY